VDIVKELLSIGFTEYEAKVYTALVSASMLSANDITKIADVPRGRVYDVLASLMNEGLCEMIPGTVKKYQAVNPTKAFSAMLEANREECAQRENRIKSLSIMLQSVHSERKVSRNELDCVSIYTSMASIAQKSIGFIEQSQEIHRSLCKPPYITIRNIKDLEDKSAPVIKSLERGIEFRSIYEIEEDNMESFLKICSFFHERGEKVRVMNKIPLKLIIMDSTSAMFTLFHKSLTKNNITSMYVEHSDVVIALIDLFEYYWNLATPFEEFTPA